MHSAPLPKWIGAGIVFFNIVYKFEYLRDSPFAWLDIYFQRKSRLHHSSTNNMSDTESTHSSQEDQHNGPSLMEKIPHPNYSIGCTGYYGFALFTQSYLVLFAAILHHGTHVFFLYFVERPVLYKMLAEQEGAGSLEKFESKEYLDALHVHLILYFNFY